MGKNFEKWHELQRKIEDEYISFFLHNRERTVILSQLKVLSAKRLVRKIGKIGKKQFRAISLATLSLLDRDNKNGSLAGASGA